MEERKTGKPDLARLLGQVIVNPLLELVTTEKNGRGYRAKERIEKGSLILKVPKFAKILYSEVQKFLDERPGEFQEGELPQVSHAVLVLRILEQYEDSELAHKKIIDILFPTLDNNEHQTFFDSLPEDRKTYVRNVVKILQTTFLQNHPFLSLPTDPKELEAVTANHTRLACIVYFNPHNIDLASGLTIGLGLYPQASFTNHSCWPNAVYYTLLEGEVLFLRALRTIEPGEEICHTYCDLYAPKETRQNYLREKYIFDCQCERCTESSFVERDTALVSLICPKPQCNNGRLIMSIRDKAFFPTIDAGSRRFDVVFDGDAIPNILDTRKSFRCNRCRRETKLLNEDGNPTTFFTDFKYIFEMYRKATSLRKNQKLQEAKDMYDGLIKLSLEKKILHPLNLVMFNSYADLIILADSLLTDAAMEVERLKHNPKGPEFTALIQKIVQLTTNLLNYAKKEFLNAKMVLPPDAQELAGFLRAEYKSLMQLAQFATDANQRQVLMKQAKDCSIQAKHIWNTSRSGPEDIALLEAYTEAENKQRAQAEKRQEKKRARRRANRKKRKQRLAAQKKQQPSDSSQKEPTQT